MLKSCDLIVNATLADMPLLRLIGSNICESCAYTAMKKFLVIDMGPRVRTYRLSDVTPVSIKDYLDVLELFDKVIFLEPNHDDEARVLRQSFRKSGHRNDHRGGPIYQYLKPILESSADYFCHLDCDVIFHVSPGINWITQAISCLEAHSDIAAVSPHDGPACDLGDLIVPVGTVVQDRDELRLLNFISTRIFVMSKEWLLAQLPMAPQYSMRRDRVRAVLSGSSALLPLEVHLSNLCNQQGLWRAMLSAENAWCLHLPAHSEDVLARLPRILNRIALNDYPADQKGNFDLMPNNW